MWKQIEFCLRGRRNGFHLVTDEILAALPQLPQTGLLNLFIKHTSAALTINENADPDVRFDMKSIFDRLVKEREPYWCLPTEWIEESGDALEKIERIVPQYPLSVDIGRYQRLKNVLSLYRLTMGQPRQEELLDILGGLKLTSDQIDNLLINLSPIERKQKN